MRRVSDDCLVEIANLNPDFATGVSDRAKITHVAVAANPNLWPRGERAAFHYFEPLIIPNGIAPHVSIRGSSHLALANVFQARRPSAGTGHTLFVFHDRPLLSRGADAPDGISYVIGNQKRSGFVDSESDRPSARLPIRVKEIGDDILGFAIGMAAAEGHENDPVSVEGWAVPTSVFADECAAAIFLRQAVATQAVATIEDEPKRRHVR